jgi:GT2 family glycosyltransferase
MDGVDTRRLYRPMLSLIDMKRAAIGVMVHDEAGNLPGLLDRLSAERVPGVALDPIVVVSSGSTDGSEAIVERAAIEDPRIRLVAEPRRRGKARAINRFLSTLPADVEGCVLISGDVLPETGAVEKLLAPLSDISVGMTGARVIPTNPRAGVAQRIVHTMWALHHAVASRTPKLGEMVAFRPDTGPIDPRTPVDEATLEASVVAAGLSLVYVSQAQVYNRGPATLRELVAQRRRIWAGHRWLRKQTGYAVATYRFRDLLGPALAHLYRQPRSAPALLLAALIETASRILGSVPRRGRDRLPTIWPVLPTTKAPIQHS